MIRIRPGTYSDIEGIARVHINSWALTYEDIIPDDILAALDLEKCKKKWVRFFEERKEPDIILIAENEQRKVIGFCSGGLNREKELKDRFNGELAALYIEDEYQKQGIGKQLLRKFAQLLLSKNIGSMIVGILEKNKSTGFYEKMGGVKITRKTYEYGDRILSGVIYGWKDLINLLDNERSGR